MNRGNLIDILKKKIVVLDGAMGTSIQNFKLTEEDYRGELLKDFNKASFDCFLITFTV